MKEMNEKVFILSRKVKEMNEKVFILGRKVKEMNEKVFILGRKIKKMGGKVSRMNKKPVHFGEIRARDYGLDLAPYVLVDDLCFSRISSDTRFHESF